MSDVVRAAAASEPPVPERPTLYFVGVTTGGSSIMTLFPRWSEALGLGAVIRGYDAPIGAPAETYTRIVDHIARREHARGALVTTHKIDLYRAASDRFDELDRHARTCREISCISKRDGRLIGHAKDPVTSGLALAAFLPENHFGDRDADVLLFGAGGAALAISVHLAGLPRTRRPRRITFVDRDERRLAHVRALHAELASGIDLSFVVNDDPHDNDARMEALPDGSLVVNATGMGKDLPGSPISDAGVFPRDGYAWELNYRGALDFLVQARRQRDARGLHVEDGWVYFLHGWTQVIAEVFDRPMDEATFERLATLAAQTRT